MTGENLAAIHSLIIDMDGVLWRGNQALQGVAAFFEFLNAQAIRFLLATNNATRAASDYVERLAEMGVTIAPPQVLTSADATARWLARELPPHSHVFVIGEAGLIGALTHAGFEIVNRTEVASDDNAAAVVVGLDRKLTYEKLRRATMAIRSGARFIATNTDLTLPTEAGLVPGAGSIVAALVAAAAATPIVIGKPHRPMFDLASEILQTPRAEMAMLGDRLDTDIDGADAAGLITILILTGVSTVEDVETAAIKPDFIFTDLIDLRKRWEADLKTK